MERVVGFFLVFFSFAIDRLTKNFVIKFFESSELGTNFFELFSFMNIILVFNEGIGFGLFRNASSSVMVLLSLLIVIIMIFLIFLIYRSSTILKSSAYGLILGGAMGNFYDRFFYNKVTDFLDFHLGNFHWYTFNFADIAITIGIMLLLFDELNNYFKLKH